MSVRVLLVDDSVLVREVLTSLLQEQADIEVVGCAGDGAEALALNRSLSPDIVVLDLDMPVMDGLTAIERLLSTRPVPILVLTGMPRGPAGHTALDALRRGALDVLVKPAGWSEAEVATLLHRVRTLARVQVQARAPRPRAPRVSGTWPGPPLVVLGASTGGPPALAQLVRGLPSDLRAALLVVQHIGEGFDHTLAEWLSSECSLDVAVARDGERIRPGTLRLAPVGRHLRLTSRGAISLGEGPRLDGHRPSATALFESVAAHAPGAALGVLLTGMGADGARGLLALRRRGGKTIAQDEASSVVWGMPRAAVELEAADEVLSLEDIGRALRAFAGVR